MSNDIYKACTAIEYDIWKRGLTERIGILTGKADLLDQRVSLLSVQPIPGTKVAHMQLLAKDAEYGEQLYTFTVAPFPLGNDEYHIYPPADFAIPHEEIPGAMSGYSLSEPASGWFDLFLHDVLSNCQIDGHLSRGKIAPAKQTQYGLH